MVSRRVKYSVGAVALGVAALVYPVARVVSGEMPVQRLISEDRFDKTDYRLEQGLAAGGLALIVVGTAGLIGKRRLERIGYAIRGATYKERSGKERRVGSRKPWTSGNF